MVKVRGDFVSYVLPVVINRQMENGNEALFRTDDIEALYMYNDPKKFESFEAARPVPSQSTLKT